MKGILALASDKPLTAADLKDVPADATWAAVGRFDVGARLRDGDGHRRRRLPARRGRSAAGHIREAEAHLGFRIKEDLIDSLGDVWSVYNSPGEGGLLVTGFCAGGERQGQGGVWKKSRMG